MTSRDARLKVNRVDLDEVLRAALRDSVADARPAPGIRDALLRAAVQHEKQRVAAKRAAFEHSLSRSYRASSDISREWSRRSVTISPSAVLALHAQIFGLRLIQ